MARPRTGGVVYRHGRWFARVTLHREPKQNDRHPRAEVLVTRDQEPVTGQGEADERYARRTAAWFQLRYDNHEWTPDARVETAPPTKEFTTASWCETWLGRQTYSEAGRDKKRTEVALALTDDEGWSLGARPITKTTPTPQDLARFLGIVRAQKAQRDGMPLAPRTVRNILDPISRALRGAVFEGLLTADPTAALPTDLRPQAVDADPAARATRRLSRTELETLLGEPGIETRWSIVWHLLALTGAREAEVIALRWRDVIEDAPLARVRLAEQLHHRTRTRAPTKTLAIKEVPLHPVLAAELARWRVEGWRAEYGRTPARDDLIVPSRGKPGRPWGTAEGTGGPLWQQDIHRALQRDLTACDLPPHRVHDLRHTFVSLCADAGMAPEVASRWTHAPLETGGSRHLYLVPSWTRQCAEMLKLEVVPHVRRGLGDRFG